MIIFVGGARIGVDRVGDVINPRQSCRGVETGCMKTSDEVVSGSRLGPASMTALAPERHGGRRGDSVTVATATVRKRRIDGALGSIRGKRDGIPKLQDYSVPKAGCPMINDNGQASSSSKV